VWGCTCSEVQCPNNSHTLVAGASSLSDCYCDRGFWPNGTCVACPLGFMCDGNTSNPCPDGMVCDGVGSAPCPSNHSCVAGLDEGCVAGFEGADCTAITQSGNAWLVPAAAGGGGALALVGLYFVPGLAHGAVVAGHGLLAIVGLGTRYSILPTVDIEIPHVKYF
jgi:hypothetical protein